MRRKVQPQDRLTEAVRWFSVAGYALVLDPVRTGRPALAELERIAGDLGWASPAGVLDSNRPVQWLDEWADEVGLYHPPGTCPRDRDGHWACHC